MRFNDLLDKILKKIETSLTPEIKEYPEECLAHIVFHCNEYVDGINVELLQENPEKKVKWILLRIFKDMNYYFGKEPDIHDFFAILKLMNQNKDIRSESQLLRLFKIESIYKSSEVYFSLYHYLFIYLTVNLFSDLTMHYLTGKTEVEEMLTRYKKANAYFLDLVFYIILSDGVFHKHEKKIFNELTSMIHKNKRPQERKSLVHILRGIQELNLRKDLLRVVYKISIVTVMIDNKETDQEKEILGILQKSFSISDTEHAMLILEVNNYLNMNKEIIYSSSLSKIFTAFEDNITKKVTKIVIENKDKIIQQLTQTKDMTLLMNKRMRGEPLTKEENQLITRNTYDILKTIPALGIFLLPGGTILLPILTKVLPFNILPSAWDSAVEEMDIIIDVDDSMNPKHQYPCKWAKFQ